MSGALGITHITAAQNQKEVTASAALIRLDNALTATFDAKVTAGNVTASTARMRQVMLIRAINATVVGRTVTLPRGGGVMPATANEVVRFGDLPSPVSSTHVIELDAAAGSKTTVNVMARNIAAATFGLAAATLAVGVAKRRALSVRRRIREDDPSRAKHRSGQLGGGPSPSFSPVEGPSAAGAHRYCYSILTLSARTTSPQRRTSSAT